MFIAFLAAGKVEWAILSIVAGIFFGAAAFAVLSWLNRISYYPWPFTRGRIASLIPLGILGYVTYRLSYFFNDAASYRAVLSDGADITLCVWLLIASLILLAAIGHRLWALSFQRDATDHMGELTASCLGFTDHVSFASSSHILRGNVRNYVFKVEYTPRIPNTFAIFSFLAIERLKGDRSTSGVVWTSALLAPLQPLALVLKSEPGDFTILNSEGKLSAFSVTHETILLALSTLTTFTKVNGLQADRYFDRRVTW